MSKWAARPTVALVLSPQTYSSFRKKGGGRIWLGDKENIERAIAILILVEKVTTTATTLDRGGRRDNGPLGSRVFS
jgi:hypothetical protein